jgi:hypothetical protein
MPYPVNDALMIVLLKSKEFKIAFTVRLKFLMTKRLIYYYVKP